MSSLVRTEAELKLMRLSGEITAKVLAQLVREVKPGMSLEELDQLAEAEIRKLGGESSFKSVEGYFWTTCLNVNSEVVHGIPRKEVILQQGDVLKIDLGAVYQFWHTDAAWTVVVGKNDKLKMEFLRVGEEAMWAGVSEAKIGNSTGDIGQAIQERVEKAGFNVVKSLSGHGVGRSGHEEPEVPTFGQRGAGVRLAKGMTLAIEAIYVQGRDEVKTLRDGWTIATCDGSLAGLFEMTVIVGEKPEVITDWRKPNF